MIWFQGLFWILELLLQFLQLGCQRSGVDRFTLAFLLGVHTPNTVSLYSQFLNFTTFFKSRQMRLDLLNATVAGILITTLSLGNLSTK